MHQASGRIHIKECGLRLAKDVGGLSGPFPPHILSGQYPGVLDPFRQEKYKSLSLSFFVASRFKNCWVSLLSLGPSFLPRKSDPKTASGRLSLHLGSPIAWQWKNSSLLYQNEIPHVAVHALLFLFWPR